MYLEKYVSRCEHESLRFCPFGPGDTTWGTGKKYLRPKGWTGKDSFKHTGYSYLAPSVIKLSSPLKGTDDHWHYIYSAFTKNTAAGYEYILKDDSASELDRVVVALVSYSKNKKDIGDVDLLESYYKSWEDNSSKENYKTLFSSIGLTVHQLQTYKGYFSKEKMAGPTHVSHLFPAEPIHFSDGLLHSEHYYKKLFYDELSVTDMPTAKDPLSTMYTGYVPNIVKMAHLYKNPPGSTTDDDDIHGEVDGSGFKFLQSFKNAVNKSGDFNESYESYFFINYNLLAEIQVYTGATFVSDASITAAQDYDPYATAGYTEESDLSLPGYTTPLKDDDACWRRLIAQDFWGGAFGGQGTDLLCRVVLYDENSAYGIKLPIINKYFILETGGTT